MLQVKHFYTFSFLLFSGLVISACSTNANKHESYVNAYKQKALKDESAVNLESANCDSDCVLSKINTVMQHLKSHDISERVKKTYADTLFFNDTLHTYTDVNALAEYLETTGNSISMIDIDIDDVAIQNKDAYVRWTMRYQLGEKKAPIESIGMTHFRFNQQGKVILHQDYWDGVEGFYRTVPVVGFLLRKIRNATAK